MKLINSFIFLYSFFILSTLGQVPFCYLGEPNPLGTPTFAKDVHWADIDLHFSIGDTITAGFLALGTSPITGPFNEYRGISYVNGNNTNAITILNLFGLGKGYYLAGGSTNYLTGIRAPGTHYPEYDGYNGATKGTEDNLTNQLNYLVLRAQGLWGSQLSTKWKMVTVYIGVFKACTICQTIDSAYKTNPVYWRSYFYNLLEQITPKFNQNSIINFVGLPQLTQFVTPQSTCRMYNQNNNICPCLWTLNSVELTNMINAANEGMKGAISYWRIINDQSTTSVGVTYQPFLTNTVFPTNSISPVDCFHPNDLGHKMMAVGLWNNARAYNSIDRVTSVTPTTTLFCEDTLSPIYNPTDLY
eukprot:gene3310-4149_t